VPADPAGHQTHPAAIEVGSIGHQSDTEGDSSQHLAHFGQVPITTLR
jgi:hypothetical protein